MKEGFIYTLPFILSTLSKKLKECTENQKKQNTF